MLWQLAVMTPVHQPRSTTNTYIRARSQLQPSGWRLSSIRSSQDVPKRLFVDPVPVQRRPLAFLIRLRSWKHLCQVALRLEVQNGFCNPLAGRSRLRPHASAQAMLPGGTVGSILLPSRHHLLTLETAIRSNSTYRRIASF